MLRTFRLSLMCLSFMLPLQLFAGPELDLYEALLYGNKDEVKEIVERNPKLLNQASRQVFRESRGDQTYSSEGLSPLIFSIIYHLDPMTYLLLQLGANPDVQGGDGTFPLIRAAEKGNSLVVRWLLDAGALREIGGVDNRTALSSALAGYHFETADYLIQQGARLYRDSPGVDPLLHSLYSWKIRNRDSLVLRDTGLESHGILMAARDGAYDILYGLLLSGIDPDSRDSVGISPLMMAVSEGRYYEARLLLEKGADPNGSDLNGLRPLAIAASNGDLAMMSLLVSSGADVNRGETLDESALFAALVSNQRAALEWLIKKNVLLNRRERVNGATPLMLAAMLGDRWAVEELLLHGAPAAISDFNGDSAIFYALKAYNNNGGVDYYGIIDRLIEVGVDPRGYTNLAQNSRFRDLLEARWR